MKVKKIVLATLVASGLMAADSGLYIGLDYGSAKNTTKQEMSAFSFSGDNDYSDIKLKLGTGTDGGVKFQGTISRKSFQEAVFDDKNKDLTEFGLDIIKEFEVSSSVYPFIKAGFGVGSMSVEGYTKDSVVAVSFNVGAGISYKVVDHLYLIAGVDYIGRKWQDIEQQVITPRVIDYGIGTRTVYDTNTYTLSTTDSAFAPYVGVNYKF